MRNVFDGKIGAKDAVTAVIISSVCVMGLGGIIGLFHFHRGRGFLLGTITGGAVGVFVGPMIMAPREALGTIVGLSFGGSAIIVLVAIAYRLSSRSRTRPNQAF